MELFGRNILGCPFLFIAYGFAPSARVLLAIIPRQPIRPADVWLPAVVFLLFPFGT